jgi:hypothetical protein
LTKSGFLIEKCLLVTGFLAGRKPSEYRFRLAANVYQ